MKPNYYSILPANVRYDKDLRANEKILYSEITALTQKNGECYASNKYFAELYEVKENAIATWIKHLKAKEYIDIEYEYRDHTKEIIRRIIKIGGIQKDTTWYSKREQGGIQKGEDNITSMNIKKKEIYKERKFTKPTLEEVKDYCNERHNGINPNRFYDFYESKGWYVGKTKMKDWKACIRTWEQRSGKPIPEWFNQDIKSEEGIEDEEFKNFIEEFRK